LTWFISGIIFALAASFLGYMMYRKILIAVQNNTQSKDRVWGIFAIVVAVLSAVFFGLGAFKAVSIIT